MKPIVKTIVFGILVWLIPFAVAFLIYPIRSANRPLFESIMPVVLTLCVVVFSTLYFVKAKGHYLRDGIINGVVWLAISLVFDLVLFMEGPMKMGMIDYLEDIGLTYLMIPLITIGAGFVAQKKQAP